MPTESSTKFVVGGMLGAGRVERSEFRDARRTEGLLCPARPARRPAGQLDIFNFQFSIFNCLSLSLPAWVAGMLVAAGGCASVPPVSDSVAARPPSAIGSSGVVAASASEPIAPAPAVPSASSAAAGKPADDSGFELSDLSPENLAKSAKKVVGLGPDERIARGALETGRTLYAEKRYSEAAKRFKTAAGRWPDSVIEEDALFLLGECYFFTDQYAKAQDAYDNLLNKYDNSRYLDTAGKRLFSIGRYWEQLYQANPQWPIVPNLTDEEQPRFDTFGNALKAYETVRLKDPTGPLADDSIMATANAYFSRGRYDDAAYYYDLLRGEYPDSEHQLQAHVLGLQSKLRAYQGEMYDGAPLEQAEKIADQTLAQFGGGLAAEQTRVAETRDQIVEQKAQRDWAIAQYYDKKKQYGSARIYYQYIIDDYPLTETAHRARARLDQIRDNPDRPPDRFKWLSDLFPTED